MRNENKLRYLALGLITSIFIIGCDGGDSSNGHNNSSEDISTPQHESLIALDSFDLSNIKDEYYIDLKDKMISSNGSDVRLGNLSLLNDDKRCNIISRDNYGFTIDASEAKGCSYHYSVISNNINAKSNHSITAVSRVAISKNLDNVQLTPIAAATSNGEPVTIDLKASLAESGYVLDTNNFVLSNDVVLSDPPLSNSNLDVDVINNKITYSPSSDFYGVERILYQYSNSNNEVLLGAVDVAVSVGINTTPEAENFAFIPTGMSEVVNSNEEVVIDIKNFISDPDKDDKLQLVGAYTYNAQVTIPPDVDNSFDDTVFKFKARDAGTYNISYIVSDHNGGYAVGVVFVAVKGLYNNIILEKFDPDVLLSPPLLVSEAINSGILFISGPEGNGTDSLDKVVNATHNWYVANGYCEARGGSLPSIQQLEALYDKYHSGSTSVFSETHWPIDVPYWTIDPGDTTGSYMLFDLKTRKVSQKPATTMAYLACNSKEAQRVEVIGAKAIVLRKGKSMSFGYSLSSVAIDDATTPIDLSQTTWSVSYSTSNLATFNSRTGVLTTNSNQKEGKVWLTGCNQDNICATKEIALSKFTFCNNIQSVHSGILSSLFTYTNNTEFCVMGYGYKNSTAQITMTPSWAAYRSSLIELKPDEDKKTGAYIGTYNSNENWCSYLNELGFEGRTNWRLPTYNEAKAIPKETTQSGNIFEYMGESYMHTSSYNSSGTKLIRYNIGRANLAYVDPINPLPAWTRASCYSPY
ncbi:TPA: hypothetical protein ACX6RZ_001482 [Photobacterium damselae]